MSELFTPISMACRHFGNILSGTVISALIYGSLTAASYALFGALGSSPIAAVVVVLAGAALIFFGKKKGKKGKRMRMPGIPGVGNLGAMGGMPGMGGGDMDLLRQMEQQMRRK